MSLFTVGDTPDENCVLYTIGALHVPPLTPYQVFERTDFMDGPAHGVEHISEMLRKLGMSDGNYRVYHDLATAEYQELYKSPVGKTFCIGYTNGQQVGHMVSAERIVSGLYYYDYQNDRQAHIPRGTGYQYFIWNVY